MIIFIERYKFIPSDWLTRLFVYWNVQILYYFIVILMSIYVQDHDIKKCSVKDETLTADSDGDDLIFVGEIRGEDVIHEVETEATKYVEKELIPNSSGDQDIEIVDIIRHNDENYCVEKNPNINENKYSNVIDGKDLVITISNKNAVSQRGRKYTDNKSGIRRKLILICVNFKKCLQLF